MISWAGTAQGSWQGGEEEDGCCLSVNGAAPSVLAFSSSCSMSGHSSPWPLKPGVPPQYRKAVFVEYTDASFTQSKPKPAWMGKKHLQRGEP